MGIVYKELSQKLQLMLNLTLEMMIQELWQSEEVKPQVNKQGEVQEVSQKDKPRNSDSKEDHRKCGRWSKTSPSQNNQ